MSTTIKHGRWQITQTRDAKGVMHWELASSDTKITVRWPYEGNDTMHAEIETDDETDQDSFAPGLLPRYLLSFDADLSYSKICERLEDEA